MLGSLWLPYTISIFLCAFVPVKFELIPPIFNGFRFSPCCVHPKNKVIEGILCMLIAILPQHLKYKCANHGPNARSCPITLIVKGLSVFPANFIFAEFVSNLIMPADDKTAFLAGKGVLNGECILSASITFWRK
jgi:hypothetical protein